MKIDIEDLKKELSRFPKMVKDPTSNEQDVITWHWNFLQKFEGFKKELKEILEKEKGMVTLNDDDSTKDVLVGVKEILG